MGKGTRDVGLCSSRRIEKSRAIEDYKINCPVVEYDPQRVRDSMAKVLFCLNTSYNMRPKIE